MCKIFNKSVLIIVFALSLSAEARIAKLHPLISLQSLSLGLDYMLQHPEYLNVDTLFGVTITEARLRNIEHHFAILENSQSFTRALLQNLISYCEMIRKKATEQEPYFDNDEDKIFRKLLEPSLWTEDIDIKNLSLVKERNNWSAKKIRANMFAGSPNETTSDNCVIELLLNENRKSTIQRFSKCSISEHCANAMNNGSASGYSLTHRLLYFMISKRMGCSKEYALMIGTNSSQICSSAYSEMLAIYKHRIPSFARDLFIEQIVLCGLEGYEIFFQKNYIRSILSWQNTSGCWGPSTSRTGLQRKRYRRKSGPMTDGCVNHITGLATAALAIYTDLTFQEIYNEN